MRISSDRVFRFQAAPEAVWAAFADTDGYRRWWPWLDHFDAPSLVAGEVWRCRVAPPLPYVLRFTVTLDEVQPPELIRATIDGDIEGTATLVVAPSDEGSEVRLVSTLAPRNIVLRAVAVAAGPVVRYGHDWILETGARQFSDSAL